MKTRILLGHSIHGSVSIVACTLLLNGIHRIAHSTGQVNHLPKVIAITVNVLLPNNDSVASSRCSVPLGIHVGTIVYWMAK